MLIFLVSVPAGYDDKQLPIGLQFIAKWFDEATLLRIARVSEGMKEKGLVDIDMVI